MHNHKEAGLRSAGKSCDDVCLVGDVGGTNCRLALARQVGGEILLETPETYKCADFPHPEDAIDQYLGDVRHAGRLAAIVIAVAGPVRAGVVKSTNMHWTLSNDALAGYGAYAELINDYAALAHSAPLLGPHDLHLIGPDLVGEPDEAIAVVGAGTGFGASALAGGAGHRAAVTGEGGHISIAPEDDLEIEILRLLRKRFGRVSVERILSGPGLVNLHEAMAEIDATPCVAHSSEEIVQAAAAGQPECERTLERFCAIYGSVAGDFALTFGARGGVLLGGGIAPALAERLSRSSFRDRFEGKGRFADYLARIPTRIITHPFAALIGAAGLAAQAGA